MADTATARWLTFDKSKRSWPNELNILSRCSSSSSSLKILGRSALHEGQSFLFDTQGSFDSIFNEARCRLSFLQVAIIGIIALGVTQVIITAGIDLVSGPLGGATAMIAMSFGQDRTGERQSEPQGAFGVMGHGLPVLVPVVMGLRSALYRGHQRTFRRIFPHPALHRDAGHVPVLPRHCAMVVRWSTRFFPNRSYASIGSGMMPVVWFLSLAVISTDHAIHGLRQTHLRDWLERRSRADVGHQCQTSQGDGLHDRINAGSFRGDRLSSKASTAQAGMGEFYELFAIAMAVIGGISLTGGRGSIIGTVLGAWCWVLSGPALPISNWTGLISLWQWVASSSRR